MLLKILLIGQALSFALSTAAQQTVSSVRGMVSAANNLPVASATIMLEYEPTQTKFFAITSKTGWYYFTNLLSGGPYQLNVTAENYRAFSKKSINLALGETAIEHIGLQSATTILSPVTVSTALKNTNAFLYRQGYVLQKNELATIPSIGNQLTDYLQTVPGSNKLANKEGAISFAGQNNRYNAYYVDGAISNDVFGLSNSGINGGIAGLSPLPAEAIDQYQVAISPFDASLGNFTGATINAVTKSGSNYFTAANYASFINPGSANPAIKKDYQPENDAAKGFSTGFSAQGPLVFNRLFYFMNMETQREISPKSNAAAYEGNTQNPATWKILTNTLQNIYHYDAGTVFSSENSLHNDKLVLKFDWNKSSKHHISISQRVSLGERIHENRNDANTLYFSHSGYQYKSAIYSVSASLHTVLRKNAGNKLLLTYTHVWDKKLPLGNPFPRVTIYDGEGVIQFGSDINTAMNELIQKNLTLYNTVHFVLGNHTLKAGIEAEYQFIRNSFLQNGFGNYSFSSLSDFFTNRHPAGYRIEFPLNNPKQQMESTTATRFSVFKSTVFINDSYAIRKNLLLQFGIRVESQQYGESPGANDSLNEVFLPIIERLRFTENALSGKKPLIAKTVSPRAGFILHFTKIATLVKGGLGIFTGRIPLVWPAGVYALNGEKTGGYTATAADLAKINFRTNPYRQWLPEELGSKPNHSPINLLSAILKMPTVFRSSLSIEKKWGLLYSFQLEAIFSKTLTDIIYTNINLLPPTEAVLGADNRPVYAARNEARIPLLPDSSNPYDYIILMSNNKKPAGNSFLLNFHLFHSEKKGPACTLRYSYGRASSLQDGNAAVNASQWRLTESVGGKNDLSLANAVYSLGHKIYLGISKRIKRAGNKNEFGIAVNYTGQSGTPMSFVYGNYSMVRDDGQKGSADLIYIPTANQLTQMIFLPFAENGKTYFAEEQKSAFDQYIESDRYLKSRRGNYAERNGSRLPFTHTINLQLKKDIKIVWKPLQLHAEIKLDIFNIAALFNPAWGKKYFLPFNRVELVEFAGYKGIRDLTPQFRFNPAHNKEPDWIVNQSFTPSYSSDWSSQISFKITLK